MNGIIMAILVILASLVVAVCIVKMMKDTKLKFLGIVSVIVGVALACIILWFSLVKTVKVNEAGIIINSLSKNTRSATIGYNFLSPFEKLETIDATLTRFLYETDKEKGIFFGSQTKTESYVMLTANVSVIVERDNVDKYILKHGKKDVSKLNDYIKDKLEKAVTQVCTQYEIEELMRSKGPEASEKITNLLAEDLKEDYIILSSLVISDWEGDEAYEEVVRQNAKLRQENETKLLEQANLAIESANVAIKAESDANEQKIKAQGEADAMKIKANGEAESQRIKAKAEAEALQSINKALAESKEALEMKQIEVLELLVSKWSGDLPVVAPGLDSPFSILGFDMSQYIGSNSNSSKNVTVE